MMTVKNPDPSVSVIIPTCRRPELLKSAVQSVLAQTYTAFELIIVDDEGADSSARGIVQTFNDSRIVYVAHGQNRGAAAARNTGVARSRGRWIAFLDDDDLWHPEFLQKMVPALEGLPAQVGVLHCAVEDVFRDGARKISRPRHRGDVHAAMLRGEKSGGIIGLVRREIFSECGVFDEALPSAQDWDLWIRVSSKFHFDYIPDVLATVRDCGERISSDPRRAILARERILAKYADEFARHPEARVIHFKRLAKLNSFIGRWDEVRRYFKEASRGRPAEIVKACAWLVFERPFLSGPGGDVQDWRWPWAVVLLSSAIALYSQGSAFRSEYVINDDVCQHIWWMRSFKDPELFSGDLLARYAQSLQHFGIIGIYRLASFFVDPVDFSKVVPLFLFPLTAWFVFRIARRLSNDNLTGLLAALAFAVTKVYLQHMAGGHAHSFGYPLLAAFLCCFLEKRPAAMAVTLGLSTLFFPVVFALGALAWLMSLLPTVSQTPERRRSFRALVLALAFGLAVLGAKQMVSGDPLIGKLFPRQAVASMPEMTSAGRWAVWPIENIFSATLRYAEEGVFIFRALGKATFLSPAWKTFLLGWHVISLPILVVAFGWWFRKAREALAEFFFPVLAASLFLYGLSAAVVLKLYAPDRYLSYTVPLLATIFTIVPIGVSVASLQGAGRRFLSQAALLTLIILCVPLVKNAGLQDYSRYRALYGYLATLPRDAYIAGPPKIADAIPVFAKRRVWVSFEMSVPLYDRYWATVSARTRDFFQAYYANYLNAVLEFMRRNGLSHLIVDRDDFGPQKMASGVYFEPFDSEIRSTTKCRGAFVLLRVPAEACAFRDGTLCVLGRDVLEHMVNHVPEEGGNHENPCLW